MVIIWFYMSLKAGQKRREGCISALPYVPKKKKMEGREGGNIHKAD
ncbi:hypothetical protein SLEP1_g19695 [Rubroshorea leprosula]|uniref:Uncharacterized protein n=1 Tax=Rubroshorea leprosula TaxID=152421 RepID=A0AAV5J9G3_9ROSI|nr:hypothetical protein SLEP1_g19695 [Rubroshorea leprosula]